MGRFLRVETMPNLTRATAAGARAFALAALGLTLAAGWAAATGAALEALTIAAATGRHLFQVEVARSDPDRARGLMHRRYMPPDRGMLFDFEREQPISMWMKDTYLPLDMVFIRRDGTIARIAADTEPLSTRTVPSGEPVLAVLELNAGTAARLGIKPGDRVEHPLFRGK